MAYETDPEALGDDLTAGLDSETAQDIQDIVSAAAGSDGQLDVETVGDFNDVDPTTELAQFSGTGDVTLPPNLPPTVQVLVFQGQANVSVPVGVIPSVMIFGASDDSAQFSAGAASSTSAGSNITPGGGANTIVASSGADKVTVGGGSTNTVDGAAGIDTVRMPGKVAQFKISISGQTETISDGKTSVNVKNAEIVQFDDGVVVNAANATEAAVARLYKVVFGRSPDADGMKYWMGLVRDGTVKLADVAKGFLGSSEAANMGLNASTAAAFVDNLYQVALNRAGDTEGKAYWTNAINNGASRADVVAAFADSAEATVKVVGVNIITDSF